MESFINILWLPSNRQNRYMFYQGLVFTDNYVISNERTVAIFFLVQYVLNKNRTMKLIATDIFLKWNTVYTCIHTQEAKNKTGKFKNFIQKFHTHACVLKKGQRAKILSCVAFLLRENLTYNLKGKPITVLLFSCIYIVANQAVIYLIYACCDIGSCIPAKRAVKNLIQYIL